MGGGGWEGGRLGVIGNAFWSHCPVCSSHILLSGALPRGRGWGWIARGMFVGAFGGGGGFGDCELGDSGDIFMY